MTTHQSFSRLAYLQAAFLIGIIGLAAFSATSADAKSRPAYCPVTHDHRVHDADYYSYYPRAGSAVKGGHKGHHKGQHKGHKGTYKKPPSHHYGSLHNSHKNKPSYHYGSKHKYHGKDSHYYYGGNKSHYNGYKRRPNRIISRIALDTRFRARIIVQEEIVYGKRRARLICTVRTRGPEASYVPYRRLKRVAYNHCSHRAKVRIYA